MKKWLFLLLLFPLTCVAQTYQYLGAVSYTHLTLPTN